MPATQPIPEKLPGRGRSLAGVDRFWLRMDSPTNLMQINGVLVFDEPLDYQRLRDVLRERLLPIPRFRDRVVRGRWGVPRWVPDPDFDLDRHLMRTRLPGAAGDRELRQLIGEKMSEPLDFRRPLWKFQFVENYGDGSALIGRLHHCVGDGMGLMMVLLALTDLEPEGRSGENPFLELFTRSDAPAGTVRRRIEEIMPEGMKLLLRPAEVLRSTGRVRLGAAMALALARLTFRSPDRKTILNAPLTVPQRAAWSDPIALGDVKRIERALGGTVNDVLLTAMAGGLRRYLLDRAGEAGCRDFRATLPVNLRSLEEISALGNAFGLVYLKLPVEIADPRARLAELRRRMEQLKRSAESVVSLHAMSLMGRMPAALQRAFVRLFAAKASAVVTNVPGPERTLFLAGKPVRDWLVWVPRSARLSLGVSILSYDGSVRMGVATDAGLVPDPESLVLAFQRELATMGELALGQP